MTTIEPFALKKMIDDGADIALIDVREFYEHAQYNIGGILIPLRNILQHIGKIPKNKPVVLYCSKGLRSAIAIDKILSKDKQYTNLINLNGGLYSWKYYLYGNTDL